MDCFYINLDAASERRERLEQNFAACKKPGWTLTRFAAVDKTYVESHGVAGATRAGEKGCFLSHQLLMQQQLGDDKTYLIMEDDAQFGVRTCTLIDMVLKRNQNLDWDILYTDVCIPSVLNMRELLNFRRELRKNRTEVAFMNLHGVGFAGTTAYIVNGSSKHKLHQALASYRPIDLPYDLFLRWQSHAGSLNIFSLFPFVTTLSDFSDESQIKAPGANTIDATWNMFRKMIWIERNLDRCQSALELLKGSLDDEAPVVDHAGGDRELTAFNTLFSSMAAIRG
jgi:GR25 family glycosyltransferase involved in LPS biosynthesis